MFLTVTSAVAVALTLSGLPTQAAEQEARMVDEATPTVAAASIGSSAPIVSDVNWSLPAPQFGGERRGAVLPALYLSLAGLNAFDAYSTSKGLAHGAMEANPLMRGVAGSPAMIWLVKAGVTGASIAVAERLWRKGRKAQAVTLMVISNGLIGSVAAWNAATLRQLR